MECDQIETQQYTLLEVCYHLQNEIHEKSAKDELNELINYMQYSPQKFTAAGFFHLNRGYFSTLISALVSYMIVVVQFASVHSK